MKNQVLVFLLTVFFVLVPIIIIIIIIIKKKFTDTKTKTTLNYTIQRSFFLFLLLVSLISLQ
jgi:uncharacterized Tic20 family protein